MGPISGGCQQFEQHARIDRFRRVVLRQRNRPRAAIYFPARYVVLSSAERFAELARKQQELADKAEKLAQDTRQPARTAKTNPLKSDDAKKAAVAEFTFYGDQRFKWFWKPGHDWIPDLDNGGNGMLTLQNMLMQTEGKKILLVPAWPKDWTADFKLHAPDNTVVEGHVEGGKLSRLVVTPPTRRAMLFSRD